MKNKWNIIKVAKRYIKIIHDEIDEDWWVDPFEIIYFEGNGQTREFTKGVVQDLIKKHGLKSMQLRHNEKLEKAIEIYSTLI